MRAASTAFAVNEPCSSPAVLPALRCPERHPRARQPRVLDPYETNSYSVPPEHIGTMLTLKIHPFESKRRSIRARRLDPPIPALPGRREDQALLSRGPGSHAEALGSRPGPARSYPQAEGPANQDPAARGRGAAAVGLRELFAEATHGGHRMSAQAVAMETLTARMEELGLGFMSAGLATFLGAPGAEIFPLSIRSGISSTLSTPPGWRG